MFNTYIWPSLWVELSLEFSFSKSYLNFLDSSGSILIYLGRLSTPSGMIPLLPLPRLFFLLLVHFILCSCLFCALCFTTHISTYSLAFYILLNLIFFSLVNPWKCTLHLDNHLVILMFSGNLPWVFLTLNTILLIIKMGLHHKPFEKFYKRDLDLT